MIVPPSKRQKFEECREDFITFLEGRGAEMLAPHGDAFFRFRTERGLASIDDGPLDLLWWSTEAERAWGAFKNRSGKWRAYQAGEGLAINEKRSRDLVNAIAKRDGAFCIYCWAPLTHEEATIEHFVPISAGGNSHLSNLGLACETCNAAMGHLSVSQKIVHALKGSIQ